jgi:hypothetical protein
LKLREKYDLVSLSYSKNMILVGYERCIDNWEYKGEVMCVFCIYV